MSMDNIRVGIRVRPLNREKEAEDPSASWRYDENTISFYKDGQPTNAFTFDNVFGEESQTIDVYNALAKSIIESTLQGVNGTMFAYGQTSSGKTHTMKGDHLSPGIIPLAISEIFSFIQQTPEREFLLRVSYLEIYNEEIRDLLNPGSAKLEIREDFERGVIVKDAKEEIVVTPQQALQLMAYGEEHRHVGATNANSASSRSHTIFKMVIESRERTNKESGSKKSLDGAVKVSILNLVDLAGSERLSHTLATGVRMLEGCKINQSLSTLGTVISKLAEGERGHIPYRNSKLTRILEPALGGNSRTAIICTITPAPAFREESISTLKFANRAKQIKNKPIVNEVMDQASMLKRYRQQISKLKKELKSMENKGKNWEELEIQKQKAEEDKEIMMQMLRDAEIEKEKQREKLARMMNMIVTSSSVGSERSESTTKAKAKWNRRETWAPNRVMGGAFEPFAKPFGAREEQGQDGDSADSPSVKPVKGLEFAVPLPAPRVRPTVRADSQEINQLKEELQGVKQRMQQLQEANAKLENELLEEKERNRQLSQTMTSQLETSHGSNVDAMAQASAFILQLQQELENTKQKLEEQEEMHELLTEEAVTMERQLHELTSQYEISESTSRQFQEQVLQLQKLLSEENATAQQQAQIVADLRLQSENNEKIAQEAQHEVALRDAEIQRLQQELESVTKEASSVSEQKTLDQARIAELEAEVSQLQKEKMKQQETLTLLREEHAMTQTKLHTSYNKRIDNLEAKINKLESEKEEREKEHREEMANLIAQQSMALACQQDVDKLQGELAHVQEENTTTSAALREALEEVDTLKKSLHIARTESELLRQKSWNEGSSFSGSLPTNRRMSMAPPAFQDIRMKEDLKSATVKKNQLQLENDTLKKEKEKILKDMANLDGKYKQAVKDRSQLQAEKAAIEKEMKRVASINSGLEKQMEKVKTKENKVKEERDARTAAEKQVATLQKSVDKLQILVKQKEDALNQLHTDFLTLNQTSGILESKKADLEEEQARLNATIKTLSDTIAESNATIEKLKTTLQAQSATLQTKESHLAEVQREKEQLHAQATAMREKITAQANDLVQYDKKVQAMTSDLNGLQTQLQLVDKQRTSLQQQLMGVNHRLLLTEQQLEGVRREKAASDERLEFAKREIKDFEQRVSDLIKEKASLQEQLDGSRKEKAAVDEQLTEIFFSMEQMKAEWSSKERDLHQQLQDATKVLADTTAQVRLLEEEKSQLEREREELRQKTVELTSEVGELTVKHDEAMKQIDKLVQEKHALLATLEETHTVLDQLERDKLNEQQSFMQEKASLQDNIMVLEEKAMLLKEELEASNEKVTLLTHDSEMLQQQADALQQELDMLQQNYNALQEDHQQALGRVAALEEQAAGLNVRLEEATSGAARGLEQAEQLHAELVLRAEEKERLEEEAARLRDSLGGVRAELASAAEERARLVEEARRAAAQLAETNGFYEKERRHLERQLRKKDKEIKQYSDVIASNKSAIESLYKDQQELAYIKKQGCSNCGTSYAPADASLFALNDDITRAVDLTRLRVPDEPPAQPLGGRSSSSQSQLRPLRGSVDSSEDEEDEKEVEEEAERPSLKKEQPASAPAAVAATAEPPKPAAAMSARERMAALNERARRMKEATSGSAPSAAPSASSASASAAPRPSLMPKGILKRRPASDDKENLPSHLNA